MPLPEIFTVEEAAQFLKVPKEVIEQEIRAGRLRASKIGEEMRILENALLELFDESWTSTPVMGELSDLQESPDFDYKWPSGYTEHFTSAKEGELKEGESIVYIKVGKCLRYAFGRDRKRVVVFFNDYPNTEFVETDAPVGYYYSLIPGNPEPRQHLWEGDPIDSVWRQFTIRKQAEVVKGPRTTEGLVVVVKEDELETMIRFTRLKANRRWGW